MIISTFDSNGYVEEGTLLIQLKATDQIKHNKLKTHLVFTLDKRDLNTWYNEPMPVILALYDAKNDVAYWIYIQQFLRAIKGFKLSTVKKFYNINIPKDQILDTSAFKTFQNFKFNTLKEISSVITYK